jgi:hypothetical protein
MPQSEGSSSLRQLENREKARLFARHEKFLLYNYDIQPSVSLHFQILKHAPLKIEKLLSIRECLWQAFSFSFRILLGNS